MVDYGVTKYGFVLKRGDVIIDEIKARLRGKFDTIDLSNDSVIMQVIGILANPYAELWELLQAVYNSQYPNSSDGQALDYNCEFNAIERLDKKASTSVLAAKGLESTFLPLILKVNIVDRPTVIFQAAETATISVDTTNKMNVEVTTVLDSTIYTIIINSHTVQVTSGVGATAITIAKLMHDEINALTDLIRVQSLLPTVEDGTFVILSNDTDEAFNAVPDIKFTVLDFWTPIRTKCTTVGKISANTGEISNILTAISGLTSIENLKDAEEGRDIELDPELRLRRYRNVRIVGAATVEAIRARLLQQVDGVRQCIVYENVENYTVEGRPPKSIECLIDGGRDVDIANKIWEVKAGGIETYGNTSTTIYDSEGFPRLIYFSRPVIAYIWMKITLTIDSTIFPVDGATQIVNGILELAVDNFGIGDDIIIQQFYCPIYQVAGVLTALVELAKTYDLTPPVSYVTTNIEIGDTEVSNFDSARINILIP